MPRHQSIKRPTKLTLMLPEDIRQRLDKHLFDPSLGRIPVGAYQSFFVQRINEYLRIHEQV
jgi:hypothetical protein